MAAGRVGASAALPQSRQTGPHPGPPPLRPGTGTASLCPYGLAGEGLRPPKREQLPGLLNLRHMGRPLWSPRVVAPLASSERSQLPSAALRAPACGDWKGGVGWPQAGLGHPPLLRPLRGLAGEGGRRPGGGPRRLCRVAGWPPPWSSPAAPVRAQRRCARTGWQGRVRALIRVGFCRVGRLPSDRSAG